MGRLKEIWYAISTPLVHPPDVEYYDEHGVLPETMIIPEELLELEDESTRR